MTYKKVFFILIMFLISFCYADDKPLFMGLIIKDNDATIKTFLNKINKLDYDKSSIRLHINVFNENLETLKAVQEWCVSHKDKYSEISFDANIHNPTRIKNLYLCEKDCEWIFITSSDVFLRPFTLRTLIEKNLPLIAPLLKPLPNFNEAFRNFFLSATETGFYKDHLLYYEVADRKKIGTFPADCVNGAYLIRADQTAKLNFEEGAPWDFIAFSNTARKNNVLQFICNEREFGYFIHTDDGSHKSLFFPWLDQEITRADIQKISQPFDDKDLKEYQKTFQIDLYSLYPVQDDIYWVDEKWDLLKSLSIKKGLVWEPHIVKLFKKYVKEGDTVLDIGGHLGTHTMALSKCVGPNGKVHVFEPQPKLFTELLVNIFLNGCKNVIPHRMALGEKDGEAFIYSPFPHNEGMAHIATSGDKVQMKTLDSFNFSNVSLMKLDIEGYEINALKGALETIKQNRPIMIVEVLTSPTTTQRLNFIKNLGYEISHLGGDDYLCIPKKINF